MNLFGRDASCSCRFVFNDKSPFPNKVAPFVSSCNDTRVGLSGFEVSVNNKVFYIPLFRFGTFFIQANIIDKYRRFKRFVIFVILCSVSEYDSRFLKIAVAVMCIGGLVLRWVYYNGVFFPV